MKELEYSTNLLAYLHDNFIAICAQMGHGGFYGKAKINQTIRAEFKHFMNQSQFF